MKITGFALLVSLSLCAGLCCSGEDDYIYSNTVVNNDLVIQIENNTTNFQ